jgi:hypothetical protein
MQQTKYARWQPTEEENELCKDLGQLIAGLLLAYETWRDAIRGNPKSRSVAATNSLFMAAKQADSIKTLIEARSTDSAMILLRSLIETYLNCAYICIAKDKSNLVRFMYSGDKGMLDNTQKYQKFVKETYTKPKYTDEMFAKLIDKYEAAIKETAGRGMPLKKLPDLRQRVELLISGTGCPDFGELYFNSYLLLCEDAHSSAGTMAEIGMSPDLGRASTVLSITNGVLCSMFLFIKKNVNPTKLDTSKILTKELLQKYNRYIEYPQLKSKTLQSNT